MFFGHLILILCSAFTADAIVMGQRISILQVPFIVHGAAFYKNDATRFSGVIISDRVILTASFIVRHFHNVTITVGVANLKFNKGQVFRLNRRAHNGHVALLEIFHGPLLFGPTVQKASLCVNEIVKNTLNNGQRILFAAAYGDIGYTANMFPEMLLVREVYTHEYKAEKENFMLKSKNNGDLRLAYADKGGPVWDPETGEVIGLIHRSTKRGMHHLAIFVGYHREWINNTILEWAG